MRIMPCFAIVCLVVHLSTVCYAELPGAGSDDNSAAKKLTWAPPPLVHPIEITIQDDAPKTWNSSRNLKLRQDRDYILHMPKPVTEGPVAIWGGHNVVLIGGEIHFKNAGSKAGCGLYVQATKGTFHLEGVRITSDGELLGDGIDLAMREPNSMMQIENVRIGMCYGERNKNHNDCIQTWAGPPTLRIDRLTGRSTYQGFFLLPNQHEPKEQLHLFDFRHVNLETGGYNLWYQDNPPIPLHIEDVWVKPYDPRRWPDWVLWPKGSNKTVWKKVRCGTPPGKDFVPDGVAGCNYRSPGYQGKFIPPPTTQPPPESGLPRSVATR